MTDNRWTAQEVFERMPVPPPAMPKLTDAEVAVGGHEIARILGVSTDTVYRMVRSGDVPGFKVGGVWRFFPSKVTAHLERPKGPWQQSTRSRARKRITD